jgi:NADPH:quinone reductase-like Zn-dependent oxidoreductase
MGTMKALRVDAPGGPEALRIVELPDPVPAPGELTLEVKAAGVNHLDVWVRRGLPGLRYPLILGSDAAGIVLETGRRALLSPSTSCGTCAFCRSGEKPLCLEYRIFGEHRDGTQRTRICVPAENLVPIPDSLSFEAAASAPLVGLTAWRMLMSKGRLKAGEDVFIWGAAAGVGTACVQYARLAGARVFATASSPAKAARLAELGAHVVLDLGREDPVARVRDLTGKRGCDLVVDYVGRDTWERSLRIARRGGRIVTCGATSGHDAVTDLRQVFYRQLEILGSTMGNDEELRQALAPVFDGRVKPVLDRVLPLAQAAEAHRLLESRQACGKLVLVP